MILGAVPLVYARGQNATLSPVICSAIMLVIFIFVCVSQGANGIDIQIPCQPRSLLFEPQSPRYDFGSPSATEFLDQQKALLCMVTQGDHSEFETKWCSDGGANRHVHLVQSDFKHYKSMTIPVYVAKKGAVMQAIGVGDIDFIVSIIWATHVC